MDVPNQELSGIELVDQVVSLTGLPQDLVSQDLLKFINESGIAPEQLTLNDLRSVLTQYLESMAVPDASSLEIM